ncbi:PorP/SprF family type IX secretion system membrane protein [Seonamhaeicola sp. ML3]|uniref:PorP/SprF family type IX secretion system membrane protein n=1 Tax=Seonamhaeicola sp. ML3 TaxID=2937786 RepID=UPI0020106D7A|nr:PorP/SprF family type IX secretion system membrane protein [Seonamhaeicola sp. ML3]
MNKYLLYLILFVSITQCIHSQENGVVALDLPVRNSLKFNRYVINPTFSFVREQNKVISFSNKRQWVQFDNAPQAYLFGYSGRFSENIGAGIGLFQQDYGVQTVFGGIVNLAYNAVLNRDNNLTFGLNVGAYQSGINEAKVITNFPDPSLQNIPEHFILTVNPGINYGTTFFDFGVSINNLVSYNLSQSKLIEDNPEQSIQAHIMYTGYMDSRGFFDESKFSTLIRSEFKSETTVISGLAMLTIPKGIWAQVGYNTLYGASAGLGFNISSEIALEYNYEQSVGELSDFGNSHEFTVAYRFKNNNRYVYSGDDEERSVFVPKRKKRTISKRKTSNSNPSRPDPRKSKTEDIQVADNNSDKAQTTNDNAVVENDKKTVIDETSKPVENSTPEVTQNKAETASTLEAERIAKEEADRIAAEELKAVEIEKARIAKELEEKQRLEAIKRKKEAEARAKAEAVKRKEELEEKARIEALQRKQEAEKQAKAEALKLQQELEAKAREEARLKAEAERQTQLEEEKRNAEEADRIRVEEAEKARLEAERQKLAEDSKIEEEKVLKSDEKANLDEETKNSIDELNQSAESSVTVQKNLISRLTEKVAIKQKDLDDLKEENDLSEQGIYIEPKAFKSVTAENTEIETLKDELDKVIENQRIQIEELEAVLIIRKRKVRDENDPLISAYTKSIEKLKLELDRTVQIKADLEASLDRIKEATDVERKRRIRRAAYDNQKDRFFKDSTTLANIKKSTKPSSKALTVDELDFGEEQNGNIQIIKNNGHYKSGYYMVIAVHEDNTKRDEFLEKVIASGNKEINFFFDVNTNKYFIYSKRFNSIEDAQRTLGSDDRKAYEAKMSIVKIEN